MSSPKLQTSLLQPVWLEPNGAFPPLRFDNSFVRELPGEPETLRAVRGVRGACFSPITPVPVGAPQLLAWSPEVARLLDLPETACASDVSEFLQILAGNALLPGMEPYAACYGGHQFGSWAGQLGDGRAISLGEVVNAGGPAVGAAAQGRRRDALLPLGRRSRRPPLVHPRVSLQRGDGAPRRSDDARAQPGLDRREGGAGHVLRRTPAGRAGGDRLPRRPLVPALRQLRAVRGARRGGALDPARRLHAPAPLPRARRAGAPDLRRLADRDLPPHRRPHGALDAGRLRSRRDEHRQHVDPRLDHRLRAVRLSRQLRPRLHPQHHRRRRAPLSIRQSAANRQVEPHQAGRGPPPVDRQHPGARGGPRGLHRDLRSRGEPHVRRQAGADRPSTNRSSTSSSRCWRWWRPT